MTPTPEEAKTPFELFKDKIELHNSQFAHRFPSQCAECSLDRLSIQIFNEAMRDYASACAKAAAVKPEEVKDKIAVKHGYPDWNCLVNTFINNEDTPALIDFLKWQDEAMRDYASACAKAAADEAEALYKEMIEKVASELPSETAIKNECLHRYRVDEILFEAGSNWMKQAASVVIAKWKGMYDESIKQNDLLQEYLQVKDKGIENVKCKRCNDTGMVNEPNKPERHECVCQEDIDFYKKHSFVDKIEIEVLKKNIEQKDKEIEELNDRIKMLNTMLNFHINKP